MNHRWDKDGTCRNGACLASRQRIDSAWVYIVEGQSSEERPNCPAGPESPPIRVWHGDRVPQRLWDQLDTPNPSWAVVAPHGHDEEARRGRAAALAPGPAAQADLPGGAGLRDGVRVRAVRLDELVG